MSMKTAKPKFTAKRWLSRLERSDLPESVKVTGRAFIAAHGNRRPHWVAPYEVDGAWEKDNTVNSDLFRIKRQNLLAYNSGHFLPIIGPRVPRAGQYTISDYQIGLLSEMLLHRGGRNLWYIVKHGYIDQRDAKARWILKDSSSVREWRPTTLVPSSVVRPLIHKGIIEPNGCTWGGFDWTAELRVNRYRLYAIGNLPINLGKFIEKDREPS